jgi:hypothetical protein
VTEPPLFRTARLAAALALALPAAAGAQRPAPGELPRTHAPRPTTQAITPADLMTRLYQIADDSMMGREGGSPGNAKTTAYIAAEFRRLGLEPAGDGGTFFQTVPIVRRRLSPGATLRVDGAPLTLWTDFAPLPEYEGVFPFGRTLTASALPVVYGGRIGGQMIDPAQAAGKLVVFAPPMGANGRPSGRYWAVNNLSAYGAAAAVAVAGLDAASSGLLAFIREPQTSIRAEGAAPARLVGMLVTARAAERMLGAPLDSLQPGAAGRAVAAEVSFADEATAAPARNVVAILRGGDPRLRNEYVAIGAHNDHIGILAPVEHDSLRAYNSVMRPEGANGGGSEQPTAEQWATIRSRLDSLRRIRPARMDSIANGADDDGSGTATLLEIAEDLASRGTRPARSILFVSHTGEELGLLGSQYFTDHPTVPRDSIVTQLNMDMVGRGRAEDVAGGGPRSIQMIGSRRLATELGDTIDALNARRAQPMQVDYSFDAPGHPYNRYCRSDHYMYARYGIPITYFSAGYHRDYHQVTDEAQYIDYSHMALIGGFVRDVALAVANMSHRPVVDHAKPDPRAPCKQ